MTNSDTVGNCTCPLAGKLVSKKFAVSFGFAYRYSTFSFDFLSTFQLPCFTLHTVD